MFARTAVMVVAVVLTTGCGRLAPKAEPRPKVRVEMADFLADWKKNPAATASAYKGRDVEMTGYLSLIKMGSTKQTYALVTLRKKGRHADPHVMVFFLDPDTLAELAKHPIDSRVTVVMKDFEVDDSPRAQAVGVRAAD